MQGDLNAVIVVTEATQSVKVHTWALNNAQLQKSTSSDSNLASAKKTSASSTSSQR